MVRTVAAAAFISLLTLSVSCSDRSKEEARERAAHAREEARSEALRARSEAKRFGAEAKNEAEKLGHNINHALNDSGSGADARAKLHRGEQDLRVAGDKAAVKLSHAALLAKVKTKLASDLGVSTLNKIDVDVSGGVVTLRGSVASDSDRQEAEHVISQLDGVTRVANELKVQP